MTPLARAMAERDQTVEELAAAAELNPDTVRRLRDGGHPPRRGTAERIAHALGTASAELFPESVNGDQTPLAAELARRHVRVREIARIAGVHENSVYAWAAGRANPTAEKAVRLADALGLPAAHLFPADRRPSPAPRTSKAERIQVTSTEPAQPRRPPPEAEAFARRVGEVMATRNLSAATVALRAGVSRETISRWVSGATGPQRDAAEKVAAALDLRLEPWTPLPRSTTPLGIALAERGWSIDQLAAAAGVEVDTARRWVAGRGTPALPSAQRVATALDRPLADLFDLDVPSTALNGPVTDPSAADSPAVPTAAEVLARPATGRQQWRNDAACAADQDPDRWWPAPGDPALAARATCGGCPVLGDCRDAYLVQPDRPTDRDGIWAGLLGHQLRAAARAQVRQTPGRTSPLEGPHPAPPAPLGAGPRADQGHPQPNGHEPPHEYGHHADGDRARQPSISRATGLPQGLAM